MKINYILISIDPESSWCAIAVLLLLFLCLLKTSRPINTTVKIWYSNFLIMNIQLKLE